MRNDIVKHNIKRKANEVMAANIFLRYSNVILHLKGYCTIFVNPAFKMINIFMPSATQPSR